MNVRCTLFVAASALAGVLLPSPALLAQAATPLPAPEAFKHLNGLNAELRTAWELLPKSYGADPAKEAAAIGEAQSTVNDIVRRIQGKHRSAEEAFKALQANVAAFNAQLSVARLAQAASAANAVVSEKHNAQTAANADELQLLTTATAALAAAGDESWAPVIGWFKAQDAAHRARAEQLVALAAQRASEAQVAQRQGNLLAAMKKAAAAQRYVEEALGDEGPVSAAIFKEALIAINKVTILDPGAAAFFSHRQQLLKLASAMKERDKADAASLSAEVLEAGMLSAGRIRSKTFKVRFAAEADWCYAIAMRHVGEGEVSLAPLVFSQKGNDSSPQTFAIPQPVPGWQRLEGACTTKKGRITVRSEAELEGGEVRWTVVGWPRVDVPKRLFAHAEVALPDRCDFEALGSYWNNPVPGTTVYFLGRPHLIRSVSPLGSDEITLVNIAGQTVTAKKSAVTHKASGAPGAAPTYKFGGCPDKELASHKRSKRLNKCSAKIERRHKRTIEKLEKRVDRARSDAKRAKVQAKLDAALAAEEADREKTCAPKEARVAEAGRRVFGGLVELTSAPTPPLLIDRAAQLKNDERAKAGL